MRDLLHPSLGRRRVLEYQAQRGFSLARRKQIAYVTIKAFSNLCADQMVPFWVALWPSINPLGDIFYLMMGNFQIGKVVRGNATGPLRE